MKPKKPAAKQWALIEKEKPLHLHALFDSRESAEKFLREMVPLYVARGYYMDKTLAAESFHIVER